MLDVIPDIWRCTSCNLFTSTFPVTINEKHEVIDENQRLKALAPIRHLNFKLLLDQLAGLTGFPRNASVLEVGCGHGWFLDEIKNRGRRGIGIEPDTYIADIARRAGHEVIAGYFPSALPTAVRFEAVFFNDVFEHLPKVHEIVEAVKCHTTENGWAVINLPISNGIIFRFSRMLARLGIPGPYRRLWQQNLPSPHLSYFSASNIKTLFEQHGFHLIYSEALNSIATKGLLDRIQHDRNINPVAAYLYYVCAVIIVPALTLMPADIKFFAFQKQPDAHQGSRSALT